jgi:hypothetical protein
MNIRTQVKDTPNKLLGVKLICLITKFAVATYSFLGEDTLNLVRSTISPLRFLTRDGKLSVSTFKSKLCYSVTINQAIL